MKYESISIKKAIQMISDKELLLPHIQRPFVWKQDRTHNQVQRFFDTIMRGFPFGTFLFWITRDDIRLRNFIENYRDDIEIKDFYVKTNEFKNRKKTLVLDGQQRLQALYIAIKGTYNNKEFYFDVLSGSELFFEGAEEFKYDFEYLTKEKAKDQNRKRIASKYWVLLKDIVLSDENATEIRRRILADMKNGIEINADIEKTVDNNVSLIKNLFSEIDLIYYYPIDSTVGKITDYEEILEIFIRANSGGTILTKSDLMFSLIKLGWEEAEEEFEKLLKSLNHPGSFRFDNDFILKTALVIMGKKARFEVKKFKGEEGEKNLSFLKGRWETIKASFGWLKDFLKYARIESHEILPSYNALIPIIYYAYLHECKIKSNKVKANIQTWLYKVLLNGNFGGQSDQIIDSCVDIIKDKSQDDYFPFFEIEESIKTKFNRVVDVNENIIDGNIYLVLNLIYLFNKQIINFHPILVGHNPEVDHIFPKSKMLGKDFRYSSSLVNNIGNYMFLDKSLNIEKKDKLPEEYFEAAINEQEDYLARNMIPEDKRLLKPENFEDFILKRRKEIFDIVRQILNYQNGPKPKEDKDFLNQKQGEWNKGEL
jgi:hypothetical protein